MEDTNENDESVADRVQSGDIEAFGVLMDRYEKKMKRYASRFISGSEDTEDAVQDVFVKAYSNIQSFDADKKFSTWLYRIAHNTYVNVLRSKGNSSVSFVDFDVFFPHPFAKEDTAQMAQDGEEKTMVESCLGDLDPKYRSVATLYFLEELDYKSIAEIVGIPVSTVGVRLNRAKKKLKALCTQHGYER